MRRAGLLVTLWVMAVLTTAPAAQMRVDVALRAATELETVKGDLKGAIEAYRKIADGAGARAVRAQALVRMAECYQKLGDVQAKTVYERILRDFSDQKDAVAIAALKVRGQQPSRNDGTLALRRIASYPNPASAISSDGTTLAFLDANRNIVLRDIATGKDRQITSGPPVGAPADSEFGDMPAFSPDGRQLAYTWCTTTAPGKCSGFVRIQRLDGSNTDSLRVLYAKDPWTHVHDWSRDGKWLAVYVSRADYSRHIGVLSVQDGSLRLLVPLGTRAERTDPTRVAFSPDGRYLAYDSSVPHLRGGKGDVFVVAIDRPVEQPVVSGPSNDRLVGWSPDGSRLVFASDRTGTTDLFAVPLSEGKASGAAKVVKANLGMAATMGLTAGGTLFHRFATGGGWDVQVASFDSAAGRFLSEPVTLGQDFAGSNLRPQWSPDGKWLAYQSQRGTNSRVNLPSVLVVRSSQSGEERELTPNLSVGQFFWADNASLWVRSSRDSGEAILRINVATGQSTVAVAAKSPEILQQMRLAAPGRLQYFRTLPPTTRFMEFDVASGVETELVAVRSDPVSSVYASPDRTKVYYRRPLKEAPGSTAEFMIVERTIASGAEKTLLEGQLSSFALSPDGKYVAARRYDAPRNRGGVVLIPTNGDAARDLTPAEHVVEVIDWVPDSTAVFLLKPGAKPETWWTPIDGRAAQKVSQRIMALSFHPDQKQVAMQVGGEAPRRFEIWALENFLPPPSAKKN